VPSYAYQDVSVSNTFNVTLAADTKGAESSRSPTSSTASTAKSTSPTTMTGGTSGSNSGGTSGSNNGGSTTNIPAIVGGVVGGVVVLGLIGALIAYFVLRSRQKPKSQAYDSSYQESPNMAFTPNTTASLIPATTGPPGSPARVYDPNDPSTYPAVDPSSAHGSYNMYASPADPYRQQSPFNPNTLMPNYTENSTQQYMPVPQHTGQTGGSHYTGAPEL